MLIFPWLLCSFIRMIDICVSYLTDRKEWDIKFHKGTRLQSLDGENDVVHMVFKSFSSPYKYRDFVALRCRSILEGGTIVLGTRSVLHPLGPE